MTEDETVGWHHRLNHVAHLEFPRETGLILRCAGKARNPFQTTQGNRLSCRDQEGRRGSEEAVPGPSMFPSGDHGWSGKEEQTLLGTVWRDSQSQAFAFRWSLDRPYIYCRWVV